MQLGKTTLEITRIVLRMAMSKPTCTGTYLRQLTLTTCPLEGSYEVNAPIKSPIPQRHTIHTLPSIVEIMPKGATKNAGTTASEYNSVFYPKNNDRPLSLDMTEEWFLTFVMITLVGGEFTQHKKVSVNYSQQSFSSGLYFTYATTHAIILCQQVIL